MTAIVPEESNNRRSSNTLHNDGDLAIEEIELEKMFHVKLAERRYEIFKKVVCRNSSEDIRSAWASFYGIACIVGPVTSTFLYTLVPIHNVLQFPEYWFELPLQAMFGLGPIWCFYIIYLCSSYMNVRCIKTIRHFVQMWLISGVAVFSCILISYMVWVHILNYHYPVPLTGYLIVLCLIISGMLVLWNIFPIKWRMNEQFRKRLRNFIYVFIYQQFTTIEYGIATSVLHGVPKDYQWIAAAFLPLVREANVWIITKLVSKVANGDFQGVRIVLIHTNYTSHALILAITVGSIATTASTAVIIGEDFLINLFICLKIIYLKKYKNENPTTMDEMIKELQELVVSEMVNFVVPCCYLLCFLAAYYGPNAELIGDVKNGYWQYSAVDDVDQTIKYLCVLWAIDTISLVICMLLLWVFCEVNLYKINAALLMEFGKGFCIATMASVNGV